MAPWWLERKCITLNILLPESALGVKRGERPVRFSFANSLLETRFWEKAGFSGKTMVWIRRHKCWSYLRPG